MNPPNPALTNLPSGWQCPRCHADIPQALSMVGHEKVQVKKNAVVICSNCAAPLILGDTALRPLTRQEFEAYPPATKGTIVATINGVRSKLQAGGAWTPYKDQPGQGGPA